MNSVRLLAIGVVFCVIYSSYAYNADIQERNPKWAVPMNVEGLPNLHKVTDTVYRSAQPLEIGFKAAEKMGIVTVLNLRSLHSDLELAKGTNLTLLEAPIITFVFNDKQIIAALKAIHTAEKPLLVHCQHGADRTGLIIALYRVLYENWTKEAAKDEMINGGYGFHSIWKNIINYFDKADIDNFKKILELDVVQEAVVFAN